MNTLSPMASHEKQTTTDQTDQQNISQSQLKFPDISYEEFQKIQDPQLRKQILQKNKILKTDAYNRTMTNSKEKPNDIETYGLFLRKSTISENQEDNAYNIVSGIQDALQEVLSVPITQQELDFAKAFYKDQKQKGGNGYFDEQMWQDIVDNGGKLPLDIKAVPEGTALKPQEPAMMVTGPGELAARFEPIFDRVFYQSAVATNSHYIADIIGQGRIADFGYRSSINDDQHLDAVKALMIGMDLQITSSDMAAAMYPQVQTGGTIAHRYVAAGLSETDKFEQAVEQNDKIALVVDLIDSYQGIDEAIKLKKKHKNKQIDIRLDSGDLADQAIYAIKQMKENGFGDPEQNKIIISDISCVQDITDIEKKVRQAGYDPQKYILYGIGGLMVSKDKTRGAVSAAYKLVNDKFGPTGKLSDTPIKEPFPGSTNVEIRDDGRYIVQENESQKGKRLLKQVYKNGEFFYPNSLQDQINQSKETLKETMQYIDKETKRSQTTKKVHEIVRNYRLPGLLSDQTDKLDQDQKNQYLNILKDWNYKQTISMYYNII